MAGYRERRRTLLAPQANGGLLPGEGHPGASSRHLSLAMSVAFRECERSPLPLHVTMCQPATRLCAMRESENRTRRVPGAAPGCDED